MYDDDSNSEITILQMFVLLFEENPQAVLIRHSRYVGVVVGVPHHSQGSNTEIWGRNNLRVVTARVFYVLRGSLTSPFILNNSVETAAPFNLVSHPRCCEPRN